MELLQQHVVAGTAYIYSPPPLLQWMLDWGRGVRIQLFYEPPPSSSGCIQASLSVVNRNNSGFSPGKYKTTCGVGWQRLYIRHHINFNLSENLLNLMWVFGCLRLFPHKVTMTIIGCP